VRRPWTAAATGFSEVVDWGSATIVARGRLTPTGVDLIAGTADQLHRAGHSRVILDLRGSGVLDDAVRSLVEELREEDGALVVRWSGKEGLA
jgi:hypothetical protein